MRYACTENGVCVSPLPTGTHKPAFYTAILWPCSPFMKTKDFSPPRRQSAAKAYHFISRILPSNSLQKAFYLRASCFVGPCSASIPRILGGLVRRRRDQLDPKKAARAGLRPEPVGLEPSRFCRRPDQRVCVPRGGGPSSDRFMPTAGNAHASSYLATDK